MNNSKRAVFITIYKIIVKGKKHYIQPSVDTIIDLLCSYHDTTIKRRWAFNCLRDLEQLGYIKRQRRYLNNDDGEVRQIPSLITITLAGARKLYRQGIEGAAMLIKEILGWIQSADKRWPRERHGGPASIEGASPAGIVCLGDVIAGLHFTAEVPVG